MKKKSKLSAISLFSGAMGLDLGLEAAGFDIVSCVENDKMCIETIRANRPNVKLYPDDINNLDPYIILKDLKMQPGEVDLVVGGPPCQPFSTAGRREGLKDFRGNVIIRFLDYVAAIKPKYFILENVRGIYSAKLISTPLEYSQYRYIEDKPGSVVYFLYKEFSNLGYNITFSLFDSSYYGVPQKRERFIMFGTIDSKPIPIPKPSTKDKPLSLKDAIDNIQSQSHDYIKLRENHIKYLKLLNGGQNWKNLPINIQEEAMGKSYKLQGGKTGFYRRLSWDKPSPTVVTHPTMPATMLVHPKELRPLSIQEYALIQQFPSNWKFIGNIIKKYKQIGNAVPVGLGKMAGDTIINHYNGRNTISYLEQTSRYKNTSSDLFIKHFENKYLTENVDIKIQLPLTQIEFKI
jgi:DNA (cytosine-5)-methyltransferase 1